MKLKLHCLLALGGMTACASPELSETESMVASFSDDFSDGYRYVDDDYMDTGSLALDWNTLYFSSPYSAVGSPTSPEDFSSVKWGVHQDDLDDIGADNLTDWHLSWLATDGSGDQDPNRHLGVNCGESNGVGDACAYQPSVEWAEYNNSGVQKIGLRRGSFAIARSISTNSDEVRFARTLEIRHKFSVHCRGVDGTDFGTDEATCKSLHRDDSRYQILYRDTAGGDQDHQWRVLADYDSPFDWYTGTYVLPAGANEIAIKVIGTNSTASPAHWGYREVPALLGSRARCRRTDD